MPKILPDDVPMRIVVRDTQLAEQLVEVPTIVSFSLLQLMKEQNVGIPVPRGEGRPAGPQGFLPEQRSSSTVEQIIDVARLWTSQCHGVMSRRLLAQRLVRQ